MEDLIDAFVDAIWGPMCDALFADRSWWVRTLIVLLIAGFWVGIVWWVVAS
jgi:hypothetical protein